jgi:hypothetical protein
VSQVSVSVPIPTPDYYTLFDIFERIGKHLYHDSWSGTEADWVSDHPGFDNGMVNDWMVYRQQRPDLDEALTPDEIESLMIERYPTYGRYQKTTKWMFEQLSKESFPVIFIAPNGDKSASLPNRLWLDLTGEFKVHLWESEISRKMGGKTEQWRIQIPKGDFDLFFNGLKSSVPINTKGRPDRYKWGWLENRLNELATSGQIVVGNSKAKICEQLAREHEEHFGNNPPSDSKYIQKRLNEQLDQVIKGINQ